MPDVKRRAWELYRAYSSGTALLAEDDFAAMWDLLKSTVKAWVCKMSTVRCSFDLDDLMADSQVAIWTALQQQTVPHETDKAFIGTLRKIVRQVLVDGYRNRQARNKASKVYASERSLDYGCCPVTTLWAADLCESRHDRLAEEMCKRSRFGEVTVSLCRRVITLFEKASPLGVVLEVIENTGFWDPGFLLEHLQVLYRWAYYELRQDVLGAA